MSSIVNPVFATSETVTAMLNWFQTTGPLGSLVLLFTVGLGLVMWYEACGDEAPIDDSLYVDQ